MILIDFLIIFILILMNGVFVAAEFSIIGVRPSRINQLAEEGHSTAKRVQNILSQPAQVDRYIASAQLGITIASLGLGMYGEPVIAHLVEPILHDTFGISGDAVHTISFFFGLGLITYLHVVIGEMVPKSLALQSAERVVFVLSTPMFWMQRVFSLAINALNNIGILVLRLIGVPPPAEGQRLFTPDELELVISESVVGGLVESEKQRLIAKIFDFGELSVRQIMTPRSRIKAVPVTITKDKLLEKMFTSVHTRFPVYEGNLDHILGIVHLKDLVHHFLDNTPYDLRELLHEAPIVPEGLPADELLTLLQQQHIHLAIVIDEYGGTAGIATMEDVLEEVVGEVRDEFDIAEHDHITVASDGHLVVLGATRLDELQQYIDFTQYEYAEGIDTIGGLLVANVPLPPQKGAEIQLDGVTLRAESVSGLVVEEVSIYLEQSNDSNGDEAVSE
ncbi:MAG: hemolysin family protein [Aggregatilineales bacterium]